MNKTLALGIGVVSIIGGAAYLASSGVLQKGISDNAPTANSSAPIPVEKKVALQNDPLAALEQKGTKLARDASSSTGMGSFLELLAKGGYLECDAVLRNEEVESAGKIFVAGKELRADFAEPPGLKGGATHIIITDGFVYFWQDAMSAGFKVPVVEGETDWSRFDAIFQVTYQCKPWTEDPSTFVVPTGIPFREFADA